MFQLRNSPEPDDQKMQQVLDAWMDSVDCPVPINTGELSKILQSPSVGLHDVAKAFDKVGVLHTDCSGLGQRCRMRPGVVKCRVSLFPYSCTTLRQVTNKEINTYYIYYQLERSLTALTAYHHLLHAYSQSSILLSCVSIRWLP